MKALLLLMWIGVLVQLFFVTLWPTDLYFWVNFVFCVLVTSATTWSVVRE